MSTNSYILVVDKSDILHAAYVHWDGYPKDMLPILNRSYMTDEKVTKLMSLGNFSSLQDNIDDIEPYGDELETYNISGMDPKSISLLIQREFYGCNIQYRYIKYIGDNSNWSQV